jgi:hypothetical protein
VYLTKCSTVEGTLNYSIFPIIPPFPRTAPPEQKCLRYGINGPNRKLVGVPSTVNAVLDHCLKAHPKPTRLPDFSAYRSECLSRTERRLLDGLAQVASDLKIWRAFRSKSRLYLASDGGLGENSATFGWVLSTGNEVLFECSGPVDGPIDTSSSTKSELGGCASSLLFLTSLSAFWGIRHRCSFRWYTDSTSAISRFKKICSRDSRSSRMPSDSELLSIITSCKRQLKRPFKPHWVQAHQDVTAAYATLVARPPHRTTGLCIHQRSPSYGSIR